MKKKMSFSPVCRLLLIVVMIGLLVGSVQAAPKKNVTITMFASQNWIRDIDKKMAEQFKKETGISIDIQVAPDDQYANVLKTKLAAGEGPDIYYTQSGKQTAQFFPEKYAANLSKEPWASRYTDLAKQANSVNGKLYGFDTWAGDMWSMLYDSQMFKKYGITAPKSWDEFIKVCDTLKANGITPIYEMGKALWHFQNFLGCSAGVVEKTKPGAFAKLDKGEAKFGDYPEFEQAVARIKEMKERGYFDKDFMSEDWGRAWDQMASGKYGMFFVWTAFGGEIAAKFPSAGPADRWLMFENPVFGNLKVCEPSIGGVSRFANRDSKNLAAVKTYFRWLAKPENLNQFYLARPDLNAVKPWKDVKLPLTAALSSLLAATTDGKYPQLGQYVDYINGDLLGKNIQDMWLGVKTPKQVIEALDADREKTLKAVNQK